MVVSSMGQFSHGGECTNVEVVERWLLLIFEVPWIGASLAWPKSRLPSRVAPAGVCQVTCTSFQKAGAFVHLAAHTDGVLAH